MEKRRGSTVDESALTKSAAWAWLERRSGTVDDRPTPEFDVSRTKSASKPSRYKVEAMKQLRETPKPSSSKIVGPAMSNRDNCRHSLLDRYEVERISRQLDYYIKSSHADHRGGRRAAEMKSRSGGEKKKVSRGFWLLGPNAVACGSSIDQVVDRRRRRPGYGHVAVVEVAGCRPRQGIRA